MTACGEWPVCPGKESWGLSLRIGVREASTKREGEGPYRFVPREMSGEFFAYL